MIECHTKIVCDLICLLSGKLVLKAIIARHRKKYSVLSEKKFLVERIVAINEGFQAPVI